MAEDQSASTSMFSVTEAEATAICDAFEQRGEFSAVVELRRLFPGVGDIKLARQCVRVIAGWQPIQPGRPTPIRKLRPSRRARS